MPARTAGLHTLHVWLAWPDKITNTALLQRYQGLLDASEQARWARIKIPRVQHEYLIAHALLRVSLSRYAPLSPSAWRFKQNRYGRPEIDHTDYAHLRFNLSHTNGLVACAITTGRALGIDVETLDRSNRLLEIAKHYFSTQECTDLLRLPAAKQHASFFDYWTLKESFIKAKGMGLSLPLDKFSFSLGLGTIGLSLAKELADDPTRWEFWLYHIDQHHKLALCCEANSAAPNQIQLGMTIPLLDDEAMPIEPVLSTTGNGSADNDRARSAKLPQ